MNDYFWLFVAAIVLGPGLFGALTAWFRHRERMAKIAHGLDPDKGDDPWKTDS